MASFLPSALLLFLHGFTLLAHACGDATCAPMIGSSLIQKASQPTEWSINTTRTGLPYEHDDGNVTLRPSAEDLVPEAAKDLEPETAQEVVPKGAGSTFIGHSPPKPTCRTREDPRAYSHFYTTSPPGTPCVFGVDDRDEGGHCIMSDGAYGSAGWCFTSRDRSSFGSCIDTCPLFGPIGALAKELKKERRREIEEELGVISKMFDRMYALHQHDERLEGAVRSKKAAGDTTKSTVDGTVSLKPGHDRRQHGTRAPDFNDDYDPFYANGEATQNPMDSGTMDDDDAEQLGKVVDQIIHQLKTDATTSTADVESHQKSTADVESHRKRVVHNTDVQSRPVY